MLLNILLSNAKQVHSLLVNEFSHQSLEYYEYYIVFIKIFKNINVWQMIIWILWNIFDYLNLEMICVKRTTLLADLEPIE